MTPSPSSDPSVLDAAREALQAGQFDEAARLAQALLARTPTDQDALYLAAVAARYAKRFDDAQAHIDALKHASPDFGRAYQEEGHLLKAQGETIRALSAYQFATRYNPALTASWKAQANLHTSRNEAPAANAALAQLQRLLTLPKPLLAATNHLHEGRIFRAEEIARTYLQKHPHDVEGM